MWLSFARCSSIASTRVRQAKLAKKKERSSLESHLSTVQALLQNRAEKVAALESQVQSAQLQTSDSLNKHGPAVQVAKKICRDKLWNAVDISEYLSAANDARDILDVNGYLGLIKEGNDAIRKKEYPSLTGSNKKVEERKRSRRFDRDFYRTCVSEGLRRICYQFLLPPHRVGIKLEDTLSSDRREFDFTKIMPGEENAEGSGDPLKWVPPIIGQSPPSFASELVGSGELVLLTSTGGADTDDQEAKDPLRGCRYVAAMELSYEPRVRRHLRNIFRRHALLTTRPTKKGIETIDAFHDYYGLQLIRNKPVKEHFPMDEKESADKKAALGPEERKELDAEMKRRERDSCIQYLNLLKAEQTHDVSVHIHLPFKEEAEEWWTDDKLFTDRELQDVGLFMNDLERAYMPLDADTEEWLEERRKVLRQAVFTFLLPQFEAETRRELRDAAIVVGVVAAAESLKAMAMEGPYRPHYLAHTQNRFLQPTGDLPMVGVCCSLDGKDAMYLASVNDRGEFNDHLAIPAGTRLDTSGNRERVITFLLQSRPAAVLVGTSGGLESRMLSRKMNELVTEAVQRWNNRDIMGDDEDEEEFDARRKEFRKLLPQMSHYDDDDEDLEWKCNVDLMDDSVAQLFGRSIRGNKEFPDHSVCLKSAVALARYAKDPLTELTYAWGVASDAGVFGAEMLYMNVHPMQQLLPRTLLLRHYERTLCEVVAEVGTDINLACTYDHMHGLLTFVPGLGPRKAANLKQGIMQVGGAVESRRSLLEKRLMGPIVYNNAVAFLRIRETTEQMQQQFLHPLDDTRLHPDVYHRNNWAVKIAVDALERAEEVDGKNRETAGIKALRDVMDNSTKEVGRLFNATKQEWESLYGGATFNVADWNPRVNVPSDDQWRDKVEELDLETFAQMIEENGLGRWHSHLQMIKWEFRLPFADPRKPMEPLAGDRLFRLITGETDQSLRPGKEVTGKVVRIEEFGSRVKLEGEIPAYIKLRDLADEHVETAEDIVKVGMVVTALVKEVKKEHMVVDLSLKMEDFRKAPSSWERPQSIPPLDDHFDRVAARTVEEKKIKEREARLEASHLTVRTTRIGNGEDGEQKNRRGRVTKRTCAHPAFRNAKNDEVTRELKEKGSAMVGEALIRPSSKSSDSLAIHWVVKEGSIKVVEVLEEDKDTDASIGNVLKIKVTLDTTQLVIACSEIFTLTKSLHYKPWLLPFSTGGGVWEH
jgi:transcription elongation factor SPT6